MSWDAIAAIAQVLAALGVIASLLYLATQVRQNNRASAVAAKLTSTQLLSDFVDSLISDPALMDVWLKGRRSLDELDEPDRLRFMNMCLKAFWFFSAAHFQLRVGTLQDDDWTEFYAVIRFWLEGEGVREWWRKTGRTRFGVNFVRFVDREIADSSARPGAGRETAPA